MDDSLHKPHLYRWKRQTPSHVYSRSQRVKTADDIQGWLKRVEDATGRATDLVLGTGSSGTHSRGRQAARDVADFVHDDDEAHSEAKELLSQWMKEKVNLEGSDLDLAEERWLPTATEVEVKREWDTMLEDNTELEDSQAAADQYSRLMEGEASVAEVLQSMLDKPVVKQRFLSDLGLDASKPRHDPRVKMELRHKQVKENREARQRALDQQRRDKQIRKEAQLKARQTVMKEEQEKERRARQEELALQKEMARIRKQMQEERQAREEERRREQLEREELAAREREEAEREAVAREAARTAAQQALLERQRQLSLRLHQVQVQQAAANLALLQRYFSAWYSLVVERRLRAGRAAALADWRLLVRVWGAWRKYCQNQRLERQAQQHRSVVIDSHRKGHIAERHYNQRLQRQCWSAWQLFVRRERDARELQSAQEATRKKMLSLLEAAATGKLWTEREDSSPADQNSKPATENQNCKPATDRNHKPELKSPVLDEFFQQHATRKSQARPASASPQHRNPHLPTEPWQITRRHLQLTTDQIASLGKGDNLELQDMDGQCEASTQEGQDGERGDMDRKIRKCFGTQPWMNRHYTVNNFEHRFTAQQRILKDQQKQINEQKRLIEELQSDQRRQDLAQQLPGNQTAASTSLSPQQPESRHPGQNGHPAPRQAWGVPPTPSQSSLTPVQPLHCSLSSPDLSQPATNDRNRLEERSAEEGDQTSRTDASQATSATKTSATSHSTAANSRHLRLLKNMEERAAERARLKAEREEKRRKADEEKLARLQQEEEERKKREEEEKKARVTAYRERKRLEKQREEEKRKEQERQKELTALAEAHYTRSILKYRGLRVFQRLVSMAHENDRIATQHAHSALLRRVVAAWHGHTQEVLQQKLRMAQQMHHFLSVRRCFAQWKMYKHHMLVLESRAARHHGRVLRQKLFRAWREFAVDEKVQGWENERLAKAFHVENLKRRVLRKWHGLPEQQRLEAEREKRRAEMRKKVASFLPDFRSSLQSSGGLD